MRANRSIRQPQMGIGLFQLWHLLLILGIILSVPVLLAGTLLLLRSADGRRSTAGLRQCPICAELIKREARVCRYCGRDLEQGA